MESKKAELYEFYETEGRMVVTRGWGVGGIGEMLAKGYKFPLIRQISSGNLTYSMVIIAKKIVSYT